MRSKASKTDLGSFALDPEDYIAGTVASAKPRPSARADFVKVPMAWKNRLAGARRAVTYHVALELLHRSIFVEHRRTVRLSNVGLASLGIMPRQKWRALVELEVLGLIR